jgi:predicted nucleotidyltransferase
MLTDEQIKKVVTEYFQDKPVRKVYLFGSYARKEATEKSDVDLLIELDYTKRVGLQFFGWYQDLHDLLHTKVDVVSANGLSPYIADLIHRDKRLIYEA